MDFIERLKRYEASGQVSAQVAHTLEKFYHSYEEAVTGNGHQVEEYLPILHVFLDRVIETLKAPYCFEPFHVAVREPFDYYAFGLDILRPLVVYESSKVLNPEELDKMVAQLEKGENVVFFANHQTEPDPQAISLLLEKTHPRFAEEMIFVAGHRVTSDPLAVPFSLGRHLICIYSKKHVENPPEQKMEKLQHNQRALKKLSQLLAQGGKCIYVAPSGGRDRPDSSGQVSVAPFDAQSIEMFLLLAMQAGTPTHFYPLALYTYPMLPPPSSVEKELGEHRHAQCTPIHLAFGKEIEVENYPGNQEEDKKERRKKRAEHMWNLVSEEYKKLIELEHP